VEAADLTAKIALPRGSSPTAEDQLGTSDASTPLLLRPRPKPFGSPRAAATSTLQPDAIVIVLAAQPGPHAPLVPGGVLMHHRIT
jgi:hypothetical protein